MEKISNFFSQIILITRKPRTLLVVVVIIFFLNDAVLAFDNFTTATPILGLRFNGYVLGLKNSAQIQNFVVQNLRQIGPLNLTYQSKKITVLPGELGLAASPSQLTKTILITGRRGGFFQKWLTQEKALIGLINQPLAGSINPSLLTVKILAIQDLIETDPLPLRPDFVHDLSKTLPAMTGIKVDVPALTTLVTKLAFLPGAKSLTIPTQVATLHHEYNESDLTPIRTQAAQILTKSASIKAAGQTFTLTSADLAPMLVLSERPDPNNPQHYSLFLRLDNKMLNNKLGDFAAKVEAKTQAEFNYQYARIALFAQIFGNKVGPVFIASGTAPTSGQKVLGVTTGAKIAYLTFDDGPNPTYHSLILDILKNYDVKATFFLIGQNAQKYQDITRRTLAEGHSINNHSLTHPFLPALSAATILSELTDANKILRPLNNNQPIRLFRPPYGGVNPFVTKDSASLGMAMYLWNVDPRDWSEPETSELVRRVVSTTTNGSIILMHSNHLATVKALPQIISSLKSEGFDFRLL